MGKKENPKEYSKWCDIKARCYNPNKKNYKWYGARGIKMCDEWINNFNKFLEDMGKCPEGCSLDRIDTKGNYEPSNCRWVDNYSIQAVNKNLKSTNKSGVTGVCYLKKNKKWRADIAFNKKRVYLGLYKEKEDAIKARKEAEKKYHNF